MKQTYIFCLLFNILVYSQNSSDIDSNFNNFNLPLNNKFIEENVIKHFVLPDGKIIVLTHEDIYKLEGNNIDQSLDVSGFTTQYPDGFISLRDFIVQSDGKLIIIGTFYRYRGEIRNNIIRLNTDGSVDLTFNPQGFGTIQNDEFSQIHLLNNGKILISVDTISTGSNFLRLNSDGSKDTSFQPLSTYLYGRFVTLPDGNVLVVRNQLENNFSSPKNKIVKLDNNGIVDVGFNVPTFSAIVGTNPYLDKLYLTNNNKIMVGGQFTGCNSISSKSLVRLNFDGTLDNTFNVGTGFTGLLINDPYRVYDILEFNDGTILAVGQFDNYNNNTRKNIVKINYDGSIDNVFSPHTFLNFSRVSNLTIINNQKILLTGKMALGNKQNDFISILNIDGSLDTTFQNRCKGFFTSNYSNVNNVSKVIEGTNNKLLVGGSFKSYNGIKNLAFTKLDLSGLVDNSLNYAGLSGFNENSQYNNVNCILENIDGSIFLGGYFTKFNNVNVGNLILINANGTLNTTFNIVNTGFRMDSNVGLVKTILKRTDGKILVGGNFNSFNGNSVSGLVILNSNGTYYTNYNIGTSVKSMSLQSDGKLLVCTGSLLKRFLANSTIADASFVIDSNISSSSISSFKVQSDDKIYIQGSFTINGASRSLLRLNSNGSIDNTFDLTFQNTPLSLNSFNLLPNNKILIIEILTNITKVQRLNNNGTLDLGFNSIEFKNHPNGNNNVESLVLQNGNIIIFGDFIETNGISRGIVKIFGNEYSYFKSKIRYDVDNNLCDINDLPLNNIKFNVIDINNSSNNYSMSSDAFGEINLGFENGNYNVSTQFENPNYFSISPNNVSINFPTQPSPVIQDFCVTSNGIHHDIETLIIPINPARPGFDANYKIIYKNKGNQTENGTINLQFNDAILDLVSTNPAFTTQSINNLTFNYSNLQPFETRQISVVLNVNSQTENPAVVGGDILNYTTTNTITNSDEMLSDNTFFLNHTVVNSYDPNDKTCLQGNYVSPDKIGEFVHYMIRFENTGTYPAQKIVVKDMIDTVKFDVNSLIPLHASHNYVTKIAGNKVEFIFENINLPFVDANNDGYVAFKIKTLPTLVVGNTFSNSANIYFDYNFPIVTNTATTTIAALSNPSFEFANYFSLYPNPTSSELNINLKSAIEIHSIQIYNTIGQLVTVQTGNALKVDVSSLKTGNYFIKINTNEGFSTSQFIKE